MARSNYPACVAFVRRQEGGNTDTPGDRGGRTGRGGITHTTYDAYRDRKGLNRQDVFLIRDEEIAEIYKVGYWDTVKGDSLPAGVDLCVFDYAINSGPGKANPEYRKALASGANTPAALIRAICANRLAFMRRLGSWAKFGRGWSRRVAECEAMALKMAAAQPQEKPSIGGPIIVAGGAAAGSAMSWLDGAPMMALAFIGVLIVFLAAVFVLTSPVRTPIDKPAEIPPQSPFEKLKAALERRAIADADVAEAREEVLAEQAERAELIEQSRPITIEHQDLILQPEADDPPQ